MGQLEILAPAGAMDSVFAAVRSGADAVYIGAQSFSARATAKNFTEEDLAQAIAYCHTHGVKVYLALNTLLHDKELPLALTLAHKACQLSIDAFIVQDVGFLRILRQSVPNVPIHASTQLSVHTPMGANFLYNLGCKRIVLSRELSKKEIKEIIDSCPAEFEVFVHGALCMSVSGQCYLSAMLGGRSGNRGQCAQPCRLPFSVHKGTGHDLSLKDMTLLSHLNELAQMGVTSAKIEGRMKRPEYVASAVQTARQFLDKGYADEEMLHTLKGVFSRSGFTDGYYTAKRGKIMFGIRQKEDVTSATSKILAELKNSCKQEKSHIPLSLHFSLFQGEKSALTVTDDENHSITVYGKAGECAIHLPLTEDKAKAQLKKTGGTPFIADTITCTIAQNTTIPLSELNTLRRQALTLLAQKRSERTPYPIHTKTLTPVIPTVRQNKPAFRAIFIDTDIPSVFKKCELVFVPLFSDDKALLELIKDGFPVGVEIPRGMFGREPAIAKRLQEVKKLGIKHVLASNVGSVALGKDMGMAVHGGFGLNITNTESLRFYEENGLADAALSFELTVKQINALGGTLKRGVYVYGHLPLMLTRNCPGKNADISCNSCNRSTFLTDRKNIQFPVLCDKHCSQVLNSVPLYMGDKLQQFTNADYFVIQYTIENAAEKVDKFTLLENGQAFPSAFTRGLYDKGVQSKQKE